MSAEHRSTARRRLAWGVAMLALSALLTLGNAGGAHADMAWGEAYGGVSAGAGLSHNRIIDPTGWAYWGRRGWATDYDDADLVGGLLMGRKFDLNGARFRIELDGTFGDMSAQTNRVDPPNRDETAKASLRWAATARLGLEHQEGPVTVFINGGVALARITNSVTDIDFDIPNNIPPHRDPDDSFRDRSTRIGWVLGIGIEAPLADAWTWRLDVSYLGFERSTHYVNRSGDSRCGPDGPREACPYKVENNLAILRLALVRRFDL